MHYFYITIFTTLVVLTDFFFLFSIRRCPNATSLIHNLYEYVNIDLHVCQDG